MRHVFLALLIGSSLCCSPVSLFAWNRLLDGSTLPQTQGWTLDGTSAGTVVDLGGGNSGIRQADTGLAEYHQWYLTHAAQSAALGARFSVESYDGGPVNLLQLSPRSTAANPGPLVALAIREGRFYLLRVLGDDGTAPPAPAQVLADLGMVQTGIFNEVYLYTDNIADRVKLFWNGALRYFNLETDPAYLLGPQEGRADFGASNRWPESDRSGRSTITFDWVGLGDAQDLPVNLPSVPLLRYLDGTSPPNEQTPPWQVERLATSGETTVVDFLDPLNGAANQALQVTSGDGDNDWYEGAFRNDEILAGARFRLAEFSPEGKENLLSVTTVSDPLAPAPSITLVDGRFKLWSYVESDVEILDLGEAVAGEWHTAYLYARKDGQVKLWWDGRVAFDEVAPRVNPYDGYVEWGSGSWQRSASTTVEFDWMGYGTLVNPEPLTTNPTNATTFHAASAGFSFVAPSADGVANNGFSILVNGVDRTGDLVITGDENHRTGHLGGLTDDQRYRVVLTVRDLNGGVAKHSTAFDTFRLSNLTFEAEDWNMDQGQFIDAPVLLSAPGADSYFGTTSAEEIDFHELSTDPSSARHLYRDSVLVGTDGAGDFLRPQYLDAQVDDPAIRDYAVTGTEPGEWLNYTRTFPRGAYTVYGRFARTDIRTNYQALVERVQNAHSPAQTTATLGQFKGSLNRGWPTYYYEPLTDANGAPITLTLNGQETLRVTCVEGGYRANYYLLVPAGTALIHRLDAAGLELSWAGTGWVLESAQALAGPWEAVSNSSNPYLAPLATTGSRFFRLRQ